MLEMEYMKLRQMEEYFKEMDTFVGIEYVRRDLRICLRLLDIVMERDDLDIKRSPLKFVPFKGDNGRKMYKLEGASEIISYKKLYVNTRNAARFIEFDFTSPNVDESSAIRKVFVCIRLGICIISSELTGCSHGGIKSFVSLMIY